ncbi:hypothetical protein AB833_14450 [Chromatiales bacterium (ex Bugula neritina AB1)]|nr:hypothetical protein AB833_14450 [Chromatiales bacterium (ex Bugula neritina AB1)]
MTVTTHWFVVGAALVGILCSIAIWSPRSVKLKTAALACAALFLPLAYVSLNDVLSRPKPMQLETAHKQLQEASVVSALMKENVGIFLWLQLPEIVEPRSYKIPWSSETAKQLHKAQQNAEEQGTKVKMKKPFDSNLDDQEPIFYAAPQPALPPKSTPEQQPMLF